MTAMKFELTFNSVATNYGSLGLGLIVDSLRDGLKFDASGWHKTARDISIRGKNSHLQAGNAFGEKNGRKLI